MKVPDPLSLAFGAEFETLLSDFVHQENLVPDEISLQNQRFIARSIIPHVQKLSLLFNRDEKDQGSGLEPYWKESSNPQHLRLAYFLYFMPCNVFRMASIWAELARLGFQWKPKQIRGIEFGAGPASGLCGIAAGERFASVLPTREEPTSVQWALIEQDQAILELGARWAARYCESLNWRDWGIKTFHRKIDIARGFLPKAAPEFNLWLMSFYLNELEMPIKDLASSLLTSWDEHLEEEGVVIIMEPALRLQSRRLLELRQALIDEQERRKSGKGKKGAKSKVQSADPEIQVLLPCLGHQACGALANPTDWCHEQVTWWRPPYLRKIDQLAELDRKTLPFSYLVIIKSKRSREEILPALAGSAANQRHRLVSPTHDEGRDFEFYTCSPDGKRRARFRTEDPLERGDILLGTEIRGDQNASRIQSISRKI